MAKNVVLVIFLSKIGKKFNKFLFFFPLLLLDRCYFVRYFAYLFSSFVNKIITFHIKKIYTNPTGFLRAKFDGSSRMNKGDVREGGIATSV